MPRGTVSTIVDATPGVNLNPAHPDATNAYETLIADQHLPAGIEVTGADMLRVVDGRCYWRIHYRAPHRRSAPVQRMSIPVDDELKARIADVAHRALIAGTPNIASLPTAAAYLLQLGLDAYDTQQATR